MLLKDGGSSDGRLAGIRHVYTHGNDCGPVLTLGAFVSLSKTQFPNWSSAPSLFHLRHVTRTVSLPFSTAAISAAFAFVTARTSLSSHWAVNPSHLGGEKGRGQDNEGTRCGTYAQHPNDEAACEKEKASHRLGGPLVTRIAASFWR